MAATERQQGLDRAARTSPSATGADGSPGPGVRERLRVQGYPAIALCGIVIGGIRRSSR